MRACTFAEWRFLATETLFGFDPQSEFVLCSGEPNKSLVASVQTKEEKTLCQIYVEIKKKNLYQSEMTVPIKCHSSVKENFQ